MDWKPLIVGAIILIVLIAIGVITIPTEVKVSTNQSSTTYNLSSMSDQGLTSTNLIGLILITIVALILFFWAVK